jgi:hypothetical protein
VHSLVLQLVVDIFVDDILSLTASTHWALLTVLTIRHGPRKHTGVAEEMLVITLPGIIDDQETDTTRPRLGLGLTQVLEHFLWKSADLRNKNIKIYLEERPRKVQTMI